MSTVQRGGRKGRLCDGGKHLLAQKGWKEQEPARGETTRGKRGSKCIPRAQSYEVTSMTRRSSPSPCREETHPPGAPRDTGLTHVRLLGPWAAGLCTGIPEVTPSPASLPHLTPSQGLRPGPAPFRSQEELPCGHVPSGDMGEHAPPECDLPLAHEETEAPGQGQRGPSNVKESACNTGDLGSVPEKGMTTYSSILAWRVPGTGDRKSVV